MTGQRCLVDLLARYWHELWCRYKSHETIFLCRAIGRAPSMRTVQNKCESSGLNGICNVSAGSFPSCSLFATTSNTSYPSPSAIQRRNITLACETIAFTFSEAASCTEVLSLDWLLKSLRLKQWKATATETEGNYVLRHICTRTITKLALQTFNGCYKTPHNRTISETDTLRTKVCNSTNFQSNDSFVATFELTTFMERRECCYHLSSSYRTPQ